MATLIVNLARRQPAPASVPVAPALAQDHPTRLHFWRGASGRRYAHALYSLIACPPLPRSSYLLVRRDEEDQREVLFVGVADSSAPTLNLAHVRQRGATLGANEVHVHFLAETAEQRRLAVCDLRAARGAVPALEGAPA
jgi:hypothetical protein